jgi:hypothetical protein
MARAKAGLVPRNVRVARFMAPCGTHDGLHLILFGCEPPGPNGPGGFLRQHWARRKRQKDDLELVLRAAINSSESRPIRFKGKVRIEYQRSYFTRPMDPDNLTASIKPLQDVLVRLGIIEDDSPEHVELNASQYPRATKDPVTHLWIFLATPSGS